MKHRFSPGSKYLQARADALVQEANTMGVTEMEEEDLETIEEATIETEATEESTASTILIKDLQDQWKKELKRHSGSISYYKNRIKEEETRHYKVQQDLEAKLLQALKDSESTQVDGDYWLNNKPVPKKKPKAKKPTSDEKILIRARVKKDFLKSQRN
jgi:hypothetical protein